MTTYFNLTYLFATFSACILAVIPLTSFAQNESDSITLNIDLKEFRITGTKTNKHNLTPASISTIDPAILRTQPITEVNELSGLLPNFFVPEYGSKQTTPIAIRGIMSKIKGTSVGFYVDGVPHFEISSFDSDLLDVKAIEVFRGPQGTLYGRNTLAGVINIYTYSPFENSGTNIRAGYGNYNNINIQASHRSRLSDHFGLSLNAYYKHRNGYFTNQYLHKDADKVNQAGGKIALHWLVSDYLGMKLTSNYDYINQGGYPYAPYNIETKTISPVSYDHQCGFQRYISTNGFNINYTNDIFSINSQTTLQMLDEHVKMDQDYSPQQLYFTKMNNAQNTISQELTFKSESYNRLQWISGLFAYYQIRNYNSHTQYLQKNSSSIIDYNMPLVEVALYAQLSYNLWRNMSFTVGARFDYEKTSEDYTNSQITTNNSTDKFFTSNLTSKDFMPKFGLQYKWDNRNILFGNITRGCKAGGFNSVFQIDAERTYNDEYNWNYEVGFKGMSKNKKINGELTLFFIDWKRQHISRTIPGLGNIIYNAGHSSSKGIEASFAVRPVTGLLFQANYGFTYAQFINYKKSDTQDYSDNMIPMVPRNTLSLLTNYTIAPNKIIDLFTVSVNTNSVGKFYWLEDNQVCQHLYTILTAKISATKGKFSLDFWGKNITNTDYLCYYFTSSSDFAQDGLPATFGANFNFKL